MATTATRQPDALADLREEFARYREKTDARIAALTQQLADNREGLLPGDRALAHALLPALALELGDECFLADFIAETQSANLRAIVGARGTKSVGRFLSRIAGLTFDGLTIVGDGKLHNRRQWRVRRVVANCTHLAGPR
jgi:hypothetical protein